MAGIVTAGLDKSVLESIVRASSASTQPFQSQVLMGFRFIYLCTGNQSNSQGGFVGQEVLRDS
jgi:hypothetical protein